MIWCPLKRHHRAVEACEAHCNRRNGCANYREVKGMGVQKICDYCGKPILNYEPFSAGFGEGCYQGSSDKSALQYKYISEQDADVEVTRIVPQDFACHDKCNRKATATSLRNAADRLDPRTRKKSAASAAPKTKKAKKEA